MAAHFSLVPSCCGITLKNGTLWLAEICTMVGVMLIVFPAFYIDELLNVWHIHTPDIVLIIYSITMVLGVIQTVISVLLGYGAYKERPRFILPWIIYYSIQTVLLFLGMVVLSIVCIIFIEPLPVGIMLFLVSTAYCHGFRYFILVVYSFYRQLMVGASGSTMLT